MQGYDSDATYCSQAEKILTQPSTPSGKAERGLFRNVRRSQRLLQQSTKNKINLNWANFRCKMTQSPLYSKKMRLRRRSHSSTHFRQSTETGVCSSPVNLSKPAPVLHNSAQNLDLKYVKIKESIDLMAEFETEAFTNKIPLNQKHLLDTSAHTSNQTTKDANQIDLTQCSSNPILRKSTRGRKRKKDASVIDLTRDAGKLPSGDGNINRSQRKTKAKEHLCDIEPKIAKIEKFRFSSPTTSAILMSNEDIKCKDRKNNKPANFDKQCELWNQLDTFAATPSTAENSKMKYKVGRVNNGRKSSVRQSTKEKQNKSRRKIAASTRKKNKLMRNEMITKYVNLADFVEDEAEKRKNKYKLHPSCPTNSGSYEPPPPIPTKPVPLLRSVANSILPKVYPPHFIHQKPPIEINQSIPYEKTHIREMQAFRRTRPNKYIPFHQSPVDTTFEQKPKIPMNNTPVSMFYTAASPNPNETYTPPSRVPKCSGTPEKHWETNCLTPELTQPLDGEVTTSTSPSLPESLKGIFDSDDLRQILNVDKIEYRLCDNHVKALAIVLNIRVENLREVLKNIVKLDQEVLKKIESAMKATQQEPNAKEKQDAGCFVRNLISPVSDVEKSKNRNARQSSFPNRRHRM